MKEIGIDISLQKSKSIIELSTQNFDYVITLCDDAQENIRLEIFKQVREKLKKKIEKFSMQ